MMVCDLFGTKAKLNMNSTMLPFYSFLDLCYSMRAGALLLALVYKLQYGAVPSCYVEAK